MSENFTASINAGGGGISAVSVVLTDSTVSGEYYNRAALTRWWNIDS
jgi:hypothetical protein